MADKAVSELIEAERITSTDLFVLEQNGTAKKLTGQVLLNWLTSAADGHGGIQTIAKVSTKGLVDTYRIALADTTTFDFYVTNGRNVVSVKKTGTSGLVDTYTISYNDNTSETFTVTNGAKGDKGDNQYVWIKYASQQPTAISHSFGDVPDNWIGIYSGSSATAPTDWQQYKWFQIKGEKGDTGAAATLTSAKVEYQVSGSGTIIPSGAWSASVPVVPQGKYLWTRTTNTFNTGSPVVAYSVSRMGLDGTGSVSSVANISPDTNGNVPLTAEHIGAVPAAGGDMTGELKMNGQPISGLNAPTANDQAANMGFVNQQVKKAGPRNLLDNSYWKNPKEIVNQRGFTGGEVGAHQHFIDRWLNYTNNGASANISLSDNGITIARNPTGDLCQYLPGLSKLVGKTVTAAISANGKIYCKSGVVPVEPWIDFAKIKTDWGWAAPHTFDGTTGAFFIHAEQDVTIAWVALYEGEFTIETLPEYQPKGYAVELAECQRYLRPLIPAGRDVGYLCNLTDSGYIVTFHFGGAEMQDSPELLGAGSVCRFVLRRADHTVCAVENLPVTLYTSDRYSISLIARKTEAIPSDVVGATMDTNNWDFSGVLLAEAEL